MLNDISASAVSAGALFSTSRFEDPIYQREYSWTTDEVKEFWDDLRGARSSAAEESYFLGLVILTEKGGRFQVVDGQQRILTLTLLVMALRNQAREVGRDALADKLQSDFLSAINYSTDAMESRVILSGEVDSLTLDRLSCETAVRDLPDATDLSKRIGEAFSNLQRWLIEDIAPDPFRRLGEWASFISNRIHFAVFTHPDPASAYRVFEAINTRGRSLTTADLLKNFVLSQTPENEQRAVYARWQQVAEQFDSESGAAFVQYIRHVVTVSAGHILPKQLYDYLARRGPFHNAHPPPARQLLAMLEDRLPLYSQMIDPSIGGPADEELLSIYRALNHLSVITVRPVLMALFDLPDSVGASRDLLRLVVRRIVVGNLGTGNVERRFAEAAKNLSTSRDWERVRADLSDLNPARDEFESQLSRRSFNKSVLAFLRRSIVEGTIAPDNLGALHLIRIKNAPEWGGFDDDELRYWLSTIGNTILTTVEERPRAVGNWPSFKEIMLPHAVTGEFVNEFAARNVWDASAVEEESRRVAALAADLWYA